jgi:predicted FMN-binding regulatory protein PaiB
MADVLIEPEWWEEGLFREQYEALVTALESEGYEVQLRVTEREEYRSDEWARRSFEVPWDVVFRVAEDHAEHLIGVLETIIITKLVGKAKLGPNRTKRRQAAILDMHGKVLSKVELQDTEDDEAT